MFEGKTVLVVDDEVDLREILKDEFLSVGAKVLEAGNGTEALSLVKAHPEVELIVSDIRMPGGDRISFAREVKKRNPKKPAVILITGFADLLPEEAYDLGAEVFFLKPFPLENLVSQLEWYLMQPEDRLSPQSAQGSLPSPQSTHERNPNKRTVYEGPPKSYSVVDLNLSLEKALGQGSFQPGRGGAFIKDSRFSYKVGSGIDVVLSDGHRFRGQVKWIRQDTNSHLPQGFGLEFQSLESKSHQWFKEWLLKNKPQSYIPKR